jgi:hypothetical protein
LIRSSAARRPARLAATAALAALGLAATLFAAPSRANSFEVCDRPKDPSADERDVMLRFADLVRTELNESGHDVALIARSGLDLHRMDVRFSHEGVALKDNAGSPWSVRELYYSCDDHQPHVFDEGMAGFLMGTDDPVNSSVSLVLLPPSEADALRRAAIDKRQALSVLGTTYSANAYAFSTRFQNCNQWVMELLASAWRTPDDDEPDTPAPGSARERSQRWLQQQGYRPTVFQVSPHPVMWIANLVPWLSNADHPDAELSANRYNVSMPTSVETFVRAKVPGARRVEMCHAGRRVVIHRGWDAIAEGCVAGPGDQVIELGRD